MCDFLTPGVRRALSRMSPGCFIRVERAATLRLLRCQRDKKKAEGYEVSAALFISSSVSLFFSPQRERTSILRLSGGEGELPRWHPFVEHELDLTASRKKNRSDLTLVLLLHTAKAHRGGEDGQMAEDAEELGQIQEQREGVLSPGALCRVLRSFVWREQGLLCGRVVCLGFFFGLHLQQSVHSELQPRTAGTRGALL